MKNNYAINFVSGMLISLSVTFIIHLSILFLNGLSLFENMIAISYVVNFVMGAGIFLGLYYLRHRYKNHIGFLFIAGSLLKFLVFFVIFYPSFKQDGDITKLEFMSFFIPYLVCLIGETLAISKILNKA